MTEAEKAAMVNHIAIAISGAELGYKALAAFTAANIEGLVDALRLVNLGFVKGRLNDASIIDKIGIHDTEIIPKALSAIVRAALENAGVKV